MEQNIDSAKFEKLIRGQGFKRLINKVIKDAGFDITTWHPSGRILGMSHPTSGFEVKVNYDGEYYISNWMREYQEPGKANKRLVQALNDINILHAKIDDNNIAITLQYGLLDIATLRNIRNDFLNKYNSLKEAASRQYMKAHKIPSVRRFAIKLDREAETIRMKLKPIEKYLNIE